MADILTGSRRVYLPQVTEATYGEGDNNSGVAFILDPTSTNQIRPNVRMLNDRAHSTGKEFAHKTIPSDISLESQPLTAPLSPLWWGWLCAFGLGRDTAATDGSAYKHAYTMCAATEFPGSFGLLDYLQSGTYNSAIDFANGGCFLDSFSINWGREDLAYATANIRGSGFLRSPSGSDLDVTEGGLTNLASQGYVFANKIRVWIKSNSTEHTTVWGGSFTTASSAGVFANDPGLATNLSALAEDFTFTYGNNFSRNRQGGGSAAAGIYGVQPKLSRTRQAMLSCNLLQGSSSAFTKLLQSSLSGNNNEYTIIIEFVTDLLAASGKYHSGIIVLPNAELEASPASDGSIEDLRGETLTFYAKADVTLNPVYAFSTNGISSEFNQAA